MPQPSVWTRLTNFLGYATANPSATYPPALIDQEFDAARATVQGLRTNIALIQRDDGLLKNGSVHPNALSSATRLLISGWNILGDWAAATNYETSDFVENGGFGYVCLVDHTSGTFAVDLAAGKWLQVDVNAARFYRLASVGGNNGDAAATLVVGSSARTQRWGSPLTAARAVTLSTTGAENGDSFHIVREVAATGAFNLNVGTGPLKALASAGTWCDVEFDGAAWFLSRYGAL